VVEFGPSGQLLRIDLRFLVPTRVWIRFINSDHQNLVSTAEAS
jgi:hypothetical protein